MKAKIFVSYSRKDSVAARKVIDAFEKMDYDVWVDWEDIPPATHWMEQIETGIEKSDAFIFFISPDSIASEVCNVELEHAAKYNKRIIPIVLRLVDAKKTSDTIREINWIFMDEKGKFEKGLELFKDALELDFEWVAEHNKLLEKTLDWHHGKTTSLLLRGNELRRVRNVTAEAAGKEPKLTTLQETFLDSSIKNERRTYFLLGIVATALAVLAGLTIYAVVQKNLANENAMVAAQNEKIAKVNADTALKNAREAKKAQLDAEAQKEIAEQQRVIAEDQKAIAEDQAKIANAQRSAARAQIYQIQPGELYTSTLLALDSWETVRNDEAENILRKNISLLPIPVKQIGRDGNINSLEFNAQGDLFVTAGQDGNACVWQVSDGKELFCATSPKSVNDAVFSPDGNSLITGDSSGLVQIIRMADQKIVGSYEAGSIVWDLDIRQQGDQIAVTRDDGKITLLDAKTGERKYDLQAQGQLKTASFSPNGKYIAAGSNAGNVTLWNLIDGKIVSSGRHRGEVLTIAFSPDSKYLVTGGKDGYAVVAKTLDGLEVYRLLHEDWVTDIAFNADSSWFATVSNDHRIRLWNTTDGEERLRMSQSSYVQEVQVSANGQWLATTGADRTVRVWNASTGTEMFQIPINGAGTVLGFSGDDNRLVSGDNSGEIQVWDISVMPAPENYMQFTGLAGEVSYSPSGDWLAASDGPQVWLLKPDQLATLKTLSPSQRKLAVTGNVSSLVMSPDSKWLAISTDAGNVVINNLVTNVSQTLTSSGDGHIIAFSSDSFYLFVSQPSGGVDAWDLKTKEQILAFAGGVQDLKSLAVSSSYIALGVTDKIEILDKDGLRIEAMDIDSPGDHTSLTFSADGSMLAASNSAGQIETWKLENGKFVSKGSIRKDSVFSLTFNPAGTRLAVGARDTVFIIDPLTVKEVARIPQAGEVTGISYSTDGNTMSAASLKAVQFWSVPDIQSTPPDDLVDAACSRLTSNFSQAQWNTFFDGVEYKVLCENLPVP